MLAVLERLTDGALAVVVAAREAARECRHERADAPHLLLGILCSPRTTGCLVLNHAGLRHDDVRERVERMYEQAAGQQPGRVTLTPPAKRLLDLALREAHAEGQPLVATAHLALACSATAAPDSIKPFVAGREKRIRGPLGTLRRTGHLVDESPRRHQHLAALQLANDVRTQRAKVKRDLRSRRLTPGEILLDPPTCVQAAKVFDILLAVPKYGRVKATKVLQICRISTSKTIGGLSSRQRNELVEILQA